MSFFKNLFSKSEPKPSPTAGLLICPYCLTNIPEISLIIKETAYLYVTCSKCLPKDSFISVANYNQMINEPIPEDKNPDCEPKTPHKCTKHPQAEAVKYCPICSMWLCPKECLIEHNKLPKPQLQKHILIDYELTIQCTQHKQPYSVYCLQCKVHLCPDCIKPIPKSKQQPKHSSHSLIQLQLTQPDLLAIDISCLDKLVSQYDKSITKLVKDFRKTANKEDIDGEFDYTLDEMEGVFKEFNHILAHLYRRLFNTAVVLKGYPIYQIAHMLNTLKINRDPSKPRISSSDRQEREECLFQNIKELIILKQEDNEHHCTVSLPRNDIMITCLLQLKDGRLACACKDETITLWDLSMKTNQCTATLTVGGEYVKHMIQLNDGRLGTTNFMGDISIWNIMSKDCKVPDIKLKGKHLIQLKDGRLAFSSDDKGTITLWDLSSNTAHGTLAAHPAYIENLIQLHDGRLLSQAEFWKVQLWDLSTNQCTGSLVLKYSFEYMLAVSDGRRLAGTFSDSVIRLFDCKTLQFTSALSGHEKKVEHLIQLDDGRLVSQSLEFIIKVWDIKTNQCLCTIIESKGGVYCFVNVKVKDEEQYACVMDDGTIKVWSFDSLRLIK